jgi:NAD(P)-dependent dehydrogenase (short-subunit alcohol dehydrogenase family)
MVGLTTSVSAELAPKGIRVNIVCPGIIDRPMHRRGRELLGAHCMTIFCSIVSTQPRGAPGGDRAVHSLPVLGRSQLHHGNDANARRRVHLDNMRPLREYAYWFGIFATRLGYASPDYRRMALAPLSAPFFMRMYP